jgi:hypothetical protein
VLSLVVAVGVAWVLPTSARADCDQVFLHQGHFSGHTQHARAPGVFVVGEAFTAYQTLNTVQVQPWYPWNQAAYEYTMVLSGNCSSYLSIPIGGGQFLRQINFTNTTFTIYQDAGTPANYANTATFTDGALILSGVISGMYAEGVVNNVAPDVYGVTGGVTITGGSGANQVVCTQLVMNDFIAWLPATSPPGFKEAYDSLWNCCVVTEVDPSTWGAVKSLYR